MNHKKLEQVDIYRDFLNAVEPIRLREPLAETLGSFKHEKAKRLQTLMPKVIWDAARQDERREFEDMWMEKVRVMIVEQKDIDQWLKIEAIGA